MGYYMGDYRMRMMGDPGFFGTIFNIGKQLLGLGGTAQRALPAAGAATSAITKVAGGIQRIRGGAMRVGAAVGKHPVLTAAGAAGAAAGVGVAAGRHLVHVGGKRHRRMRVTNPRALRRAIRRAQGFARLARRVLHFTSPRHVKGRAVFKVHRKKRGF